MLTLIRHIKFSFRKDRKIISCHYCGGAFSFNESDANHVLFACGDCKSPKTNKVKQNKYLSLPQGYYNNNILS